MPNSQPSISPIPGPWWRPSYRVTADWHCVWTARDGKTHRILVPEGMLLDGSTEWLVIALGVLPGWFLWVFGVAQDGLHRAAFVGHDRVYAVAGRLKVETLTEVGHGDGLEWVRPSSLNDPQPPMTRTEADWLLLDVQRTRQVPWWRRYPRWAVVRVFGGPVWWWRKMKRTPRPGRGDTSARR